MAERIGSNEPFQPLSSQSTVPLEAVRYDTSTGLVPVVVQDATSGHVLMLAYANREALKRTFGTGQAWFWSRSRQDFWRKGATSGHVQRVVDVRLDCDGDTVLYLVEPAGPACHTGEATCFYRGLARSVDEPAQQELATPTSNAGSSATSERVDTPIDDPVTTDGTEAGDFGTLSGLWETVTDRWMKRPQGSYTTYLFEQGVDKAAKKVGEEAVEIVLAAKNAVGPGADGAELASESADLLYHLMVLWRVCGLSPADVLNVLAKRRS